MNKPLLHPKCLDGGLNNGQEWARIGTTFSAPNMAVCPDPHIHDVYALFSRTAVTEIKRGQSERKAVSSIKHDWFLRAQKGNSQFVCVRCFACVYGREDVFHVQTQTRKNKRKIEKGAWRGEVPRSKQNKTKEDKCLLLKFFIAFFIFLSALVVCLLVWLVVVYQSYC